ncbi:MAG: hypothetical protein IRZ03_16985 [Acidobacterium ailaaui]|nr:hypothetical protein [Pseudacidobacterium ailaaui]MDI3256057.1 hypothetical protein [Bacillota bacterium]
MKKVIIVPLSEIHRFPGTSVLAQGSTIAALMGESSVARSRASFPSEEEFYDAVACGNADLQTFATEEDARDFARNKIRFLEEKAKTFQEILSRNANASAKKPATKTKGRPRQVLEQVV